MANVFITREGERERVRDFSAVRSFTRGRRYYSAFLRVYDEKGDVLDVCESSRGVRKFFEKHAGRDVRYCSFLGGCNDGEEYPAYMEG